MAGAGDSSGSFRVSVADDGQCPVVRGDAVALELRVDDTGNNYYEVPAVIERIRIDTNITDGDTVVWAIEFAGNGPVTPHGVLSAGVSE